MNLIGVIRHSTAEQVSEGRAGVERQRKDIETIQHYTGATIIRTIEVVESGTLVLDNKQFQRVFRDLADPSIDGVACSALDRLVRPANFSDMAIFDHFRSNGKRIYTPSGVIDPNTQSGWMESMLRGMFAGLEREEIRKRTMGGKERLRMQKRHVNGAMSLPRGVLFDKSTGIWSYDLAGDARVIPVIFDLFVNRKLSYHGIADSVGNGWSYNGVRSTLSNKIWIGVRVYDREKTGPVIRSKNLGEDGEPRKYRRLGPRNQVIELRVIEKGLISESLFERAQEELRRRATEHGRRKRAPRFLASGLLRCSCGARWYTRSGCGRKKHRDYYFCPRCKSPSLQREAVDGAIQQLLSEELLKLEVLNQILAAIPETAPGDDRKRAQASAKLDREYEKLLDLYQKTDLSREQFNERKKKIEADRAALSTLYPAPQPQVSPKELALALVETFTGFHQLLYSEQRAILQRAVSRITMSGREMVSMALSGGFIGEVGAKLSPHSTRRYWRRSQC
jgi:DNA invertase Pin-like site-specific DNA recombinase